MGFGLLARQFFFGITLLLAAPEQFQRGALKAQALADLPFHIAAVGVAKQLGIVDEQGEAGGPGGDLGAVVNPALATAAAGGGGTPAHRLLEHLIHHRGADAATVLLHGHGRHRKDALDPLAGEGRGEQHRRPIEEIELGAQLLFHGRHGVAVLLHRVPLVDDDHAGAAIFFDAAGQALVLLGDAIEHIDHQGADIAALNRLETAVDAEIFRAVIHAAAAADAGGVEQFPALAFPLDRGVDRVAGGAPDRADDRPFLAANGIEQARFADVGPADDRQLDRLLLLHLGGGGQVGEQGIEQLGGAGAVDGRHRVGLAQAQAPELGRHGQALVGRFAFVHRQQHRAALAPQPLGDRLVGGGEPLLAIGDHHGHGRLGQGQVGLFADLRQKFAVVIEHQAARIDDPEGAIAPEPLLVGAVPGHPGLVMHDRFPAPAEPVHQG